MIQLQPMNYNEYQNFFKTVFFILNETTFTIYVTGIFANKLITKQIHIDKYSLITSSTVLNESLTALYTYLLI